MARRKRQLQLLLIAVLFPAIVLSILAMKISGSSGGAQVSNRGLSNRGL
jgi:hypothetical protein